MPHAPRFALAVSVVCAALAVLNCGSDELSSDSTASGGSPGPTTAKATSKDGGNTSVSASPSPSPPASNTDGGATRDATAATSDAQSIVDASKPDTASNIPPVTNPADPCATVTCAAGEACVPFAHGQALGACVPTCDCSNCGNCGGDNADRRWDDQQEYCGNRASSPATTACNRPCEGGGMGCIPFGSVNICWPLEGCFSL